jgi:fumarate reductase flavoprotein subunit
MTIEPTPADGFDTEIAAIVVGAGSAGLTAGLALRDADVEVMVLERDDKPRGSTSMSQGYLCAAGTAAQRAAGIDDTADVFFQDIMARSRNVADPVVARAVADTAGPMMDWLHDRHHVPFGLNNPISWAGFFGHSRNRQHGVPSRTGEELHGALIRAFEEAGGMLVTGAHVQALYADPDGRVTGVRVHRADGAVERIGCRAVVLATCGFGANREMVRKYIPDFGNAPNYRYFGHEGNQGEGILWGIDLGADIACMDSFQGYGALAEPQGILVNYDMVLRGAICVNIEGKRFSNEAQDISAQSLKVLAQPEGLGWVVFDDTRRAVVAHLPEFRELTRLGAVRSAETAAELAALIRVPAAALEETLASVHRMAAGLETCAFGRDFTANPPLTGPLHAIKVTGALFHTQGGLRIDGGARVLRKDGSPLPNLMAAGGTACSISGHGCDGYLPSAGLCMAMTLGRLAGLSAAELAQA